MSTLEIPASYENITPDWLTQALRSTGTLDDATSVAAFKTSRIGEGLGFSGEIVRFALDYDHPAEDAPASIVGKFPSIARFADPAPDLIQSIAQANLREIRFYREIAPQVPLGTPRFYYGDVNVEQGHSVLLIEDIANARVGDLIAGADAAETRLVIESIAGLHAALWEKPQLHAIDWTFTQGTDPEGVAAAYRQVWPVFAEQFADTCPAAILDIGPLLGVHLPRILHQVSTPPHTLLHYDFHGRNMLFREGELLIIDWQGAAKGRAAYDVAYYLALCVEAETRRAMEDDLLASYHALLLAGGVRDYAPEDLRTDYRLALVSVAMTVIYISVKLDLSSEEDQALVKMVWPRLAAMLADHDIGELLA